MIRSVHALMGRAHADADDVVQQAMIALVQSLPQFRGECSPQHYASRIVARMVVATKRRGKLRAERRDEETDVDMVQSQNLSQHDQMTAERRREVVRELMTTLPEEQAETFAMRVGLGFSLPEVAAATQVPLNTVRSRVRLAKEALKKRIDADPALLEMLGDES
jgi:RNA polymerase sigma-70 factor (ECF subfamily)